METEGKTFNFASWNTMVEAVWLLCDFCLEPTASVTFVLADYGNGKWRVCGWLPYKTRAFYTCSSTGSRLIFGMYTPQ